MYVNWKLTGESFFFCSFACCRLKSENRLTVT